MVAIRKPNETEHFPNGETVERREGGELISFLQQFRSCNKMKTKVCSTGMKTSLIP